MVYLPLPNSWLRALGVLLSVDDRGTMTTNLVDRSRLCAVVNHLSVAPSSLNVVPSTVFITVCVDSGRSGWVTQLYVLISPHRMKTILKRIACAYNFW